MLNISDIYRALTHILTMLWPTAILFFVPNINSHTTAESKIHLSFHIKQNHSENWQSLLSAAQLICKDLGQQKPSYLKMNLCAYEIEGWFAGVWAPLFQWVT